jgi:hypothetical protein
MNFVLKLLYLFRSETLFVPFKFNESINSGATFYFFKYVIYNILKSCHSCIISLELEVLNDS